MYNFLTVCVGKAYSAEYVNAIYRMVKRHFKEPFEFYCITDKFSYELAKPIRKIQPTHNLPGWWNKLYMFSTIVPEGRLIYLDLDLIIRDDITEIISGYDGVYCGDEDHIHWGETTFGPKADYPKELGRPIDCSLGTAFVSMQAHALPQVWDYYLENQEQVETIFKEYGDQLYTSWILNGKFDLWEKLYPETHGIGSYKFNVLGKEPYLNEERKHLLRGKIPYDKLRIINFHGKPKPHQLLDIDWIRGNWLAD